MVVGRGGSLRKLIRLGRGKGPPRDGGSAWGRTPDCWVEKREAGKQDQGKWSWQSRSPDQSPLGEDESLRLPGRAVKDRKGERGKRGEKNGKIEVGRKGLE